MGTPYCPNLECSQKFLKKEQIICPLCGTPAQEFGFLDASKLCVEKGRKERERKSEQKVKEGAKAILISESMTDAEIRSRITEDMKNLAMHEAGTGWMRLGTLLGSSTDQMLGAGFKALIDQNKITIRQNELILRTLTKIANIEKP
jgi:hypothetical protein